MISESGINTSWAVVKPRLLNRLVMIQGPVIDSQAFYKRTDVDHVSFGDAAVSYRRFGQGETFVFINGLPIRGHNWLQLLPRLSDWFQCITPDLPGLGDSIWTDRTDFSRDTQAYYVLQEFNAKGIGNFTLVAYDSGVTVPRQPFLTRPLIY
jgi:hypothetical protein